MYEKSKQLQFFLKFFFGMPIAYIFLSRDQDGPRRRTRLATGMWTAAAGATAQSQNLDVIANNLANSDTPAFKKDVPTFKEYLATIEREHGPQDIPRGPIKDKDFYPLDGRDESRVLMDGTSTRLQQGNLRVTQGQFDLALDGPGFFEVVTPVGIRFTRQGSLKINGEGRLVTSEGYPLLLSQSGGLAGTTLGGVTGQANLQPPLQQGLARAGQIPPNVAGRYVNLRDRGTHFLINTQGEIYSGDELIGRLSVVEFQNPQKLRKVGGQLFENKDPNNATIVSQQTNVRQGVLETSNVNPIEEMTNMIKANRLFEQDLKALKTYGELLGKEANDIGKL